MMSLTPTPLPQAEPQSLNVPELLQHINTLDAQVRYLHDRLETAAQVSHAAAIPIAPSPPVPSQAAPHSSHPHDSSRAEHLPTTILSKLLSRPSQFHGKHGQEVYDWLSELDILFENIGSVTDRQKMTFAVQCLRGEALHWWVAREKEVELSHARVAYMPASRESILPIEPEKFHPTRTLTTWMEFKQVFVEYFCPRGASEAARMQLHNLRQGQFGSLAAYCDRFETIARRIATSPGQDISDELIATFKAGVSNPIIRLHLTTAAPHSLFEATRYAMQAESDLRSSSVSMSNFRESRTGTQHAANNHSRYGGRWNQSFPHRARTGYGYGDHASTSSQRETRDTSTPMDLSAAVDDSAVGQDETGWELDSTGDKPDEEEKSPEPAPESPGDVSSSSSSEGESQSVNFVSRNSRLGGRNSNRGNAYGDRTRPFGRNQLPGKQQFLRINPCWNCGKPGHFMVDCPFQRSALIPSLTPNMSKPSSKNP